MHKCNGGAISFGVLGRQIDTNANMPLYKVQRRCFTSLWCVSRKASGTYGACASSHCHHEGGKT